MRHRRSAWFAALVTSVLGFALVRNPDAGRDALTAAVAPVSMPPQNLGFPPYDAVYGSSTHNSYWVDRDAAGERAASGTEERILDQLLHEHVRALELDIHFSDGHPSVWSVYHTDKESNSLCSPLSECLKQLQVFQYLAPEHEVINVIIELKELVWDHVFRPGHTIAQFDRLLRDYLGDALYTPRDFLARCPPGMSLRGCARTAGWPTIDRLRGKFIVNVLGNWNYNANDWVDYATKEGGVSERVAFPMRSILDVEGRETTGLFGAGRHEPFDAAALAAAREASIFWQVEALEYPEIDRFIREHGLVRARSAHSYAEQLARIRRGFQLIQNDHPWHFVEEAGGAAGVPIDPTRRLRQARVILGQVLEWPAAALVEPGQRLYAMAAGDGSWVTASCAVEATQSEWETAPSTTRPRATSWGLNVARFQLVRDTFEGRARARGLGCLRAAASRSDDYFMVCRQVVDGEYAQVSVRFRRGGEPGETVHAFDSDAHSAGLVGELLRMRVTTDADRSCASAWSASQLRDGAPAWNALGAVCFAVPLVEQGLAATRDVLFVGTRHDHAGIGAAALPHRSPSGRLVDLCQPSNGSR